MFTWSPFTSSSVLLHCSRAHLCFLDSSSLKHFHVTSYDIFCASSLCQQGRGHESMSKPWSLNCKVWGKSCGDITEGAETQLAILDILMVCGDQHYLYVTKLQMRLMFNKTMWNASVIFCKNTFCCKTKAVMLKKYMCPVYFLFFKVKIII